MYRQENVQDAMQISENQNFIRACLFNLIVIADSEVRANRCQALIRIITEKYPCKIIFVRSEEIATDTFKQTTSSYTSGVGSNTVFCDQVMIDVSKNQFHKVPFVITSKIAPDLPIFVLLAHDPTVDMTHLLTKIDAISNRVIFDIDAVSNIHRFATHMLSLIETNCTEYIDLVWAQTKSWRDILAQVFREGEKLKSLKKAKDIQISFVSDRDSPLSKHFMEALYLQAWLALLLKWKITACTVVDNCLKISYEHIYGALTVSIVPRDYQGISVGAICAFECATYDESHYLISYEGVKHHVVVHASNLERCEVPYPLFIKNFTKGSLLVNELFYAQQGSNYKKVLETFTHTLWKNQQLG